MEKKEFSFFSRGFPTNTTPKQRRHATFQEVVFHNYFTRDWNLRQKHVQPKFSGKNDFEKREPSVLLAVSCISDHQWSSFAYRQRNVVILFSSFS